MAFLLGFWQDYIDQDELDLGSVNLHTAQPMLQASQLLQGATYHTSAFSARIPRVPHIETTAHSLACAELLRLI